MNLKDFKAGLYKQQEQYKSFSPSSINHDWTWDDNRINILLEEANRKLGELNAFSLYIPHVYTFIKMYTLKETTQSSRIEGTQTELEDILRDIQDIDPEKRDDWQEVQNYISAIDYAITELQHLPLSNRVLKNAHRMLLQGVRGKHKTPGEFRKSQNWIGATLKDATFIPPHYSEVEELMSDLEKFMHNDTIEVPHLIRIAILHYQFETIHPFLDGNGRLGRLLITLYLVSNGLLKYPSLYLSDYLEEHKSHYINNLMFARINNDITQWIKFFLVAIIETAKNGIDTFQKIIDLKTNIEEQRIINLGKKLPKAKKLLNILYQYPIIKTQQVIEELKISAPTANNLLQDLVDRNILIEITGFKRNRIFVFHEYLRLFQK